MEALAFRWPLLMRLRDWIWTINETKMGLGNIP